MSRLKDPLLLVLVALIVFSVALRFVCLDADIPRLQGADDIGDEGYWAWRARDLVRSGTIDRGSNFYQALAGAPLTVATLWGLGSLFGGLTLWVTRFPSALYSSLTILLGAYYFASLRKNGVAALSFVCLYGLFPLTLFYSRIAHLEQHLLFFALLSFVLLERKRDTWGLLLSGLFFSLAFAVKSATLILLPALLLAVLLFYRSHSIRALLTLGLGALPVVALHLGFILSHSGLFEPTLRTLASYHRKSGLFIDHFSIVYFWLSPLVVWYLPFIVCGLFFSAWWVLRKRRISWFWIWILVTFVVLSLFRYQSFARHHLFFFPLLLAASDGLGETALRLRSGRTRRLFLCVLLSGLALSLFLGTWSIGSSTFLEPDYSYRDASRRLSWITSNHDRVTGLHAHALSLEADYRPRINLNSPFWASIDPVRSTHPTIVLIASRYNGKNLKAAAWPRREQFKYLEKIDEISYLDRFTLGVYRIARNKAGLRDFLSFRQGRASRYDSLIFNRYREKRETGCLVKALQVAESRGDAEISHQKVSSTGCAGMFGFCYQTSQDPLFRDLFVQTRRERPVAPGDFEKDDRFDPRRSLAAAERYIERLMGLFEGLTDQRQFAFASYNGGPGFVQHVLTRTGKADPRWRQDVLPILEGDDTSEFPLYSTWPKPQRDHKLRTEIPLYVEDAMGTYEACINRATFQAFSIEP